MRSMHRLLCVSLVWIIVQFVYLKVRSKMPIANIGWNVRCKSQLKINILVLGWVRLGFVIAPINLMVVCIQLTRDLGAGKYDLNREITRHSIKHHK